MSFPTISTWRFRALGYVAAVLGTLFANAAYAVPVLFYSDIDSGPAGSYVTIWGKDFGNSTGVVNVGSTPAQILSWSPSKVEFKVSPNAGNNITLTTGGESSNNLPFTTRAGRLFFVSSLDGNNSNDGLAETNQGNGAGPWRDLSPVLGNVRDGDIVYVRAGIYDAVSNSTYGTNFFVRQAHSGSQGNPIALVGYPGEAPIIGGLPGSSATRRAILIEYGVTDWTIAKLRLRANSAAFEIGQRGGTDRIRVIGNEASDVPSGTGTFAINAVNNLKLYGNHIYNSGQVGNKLAHLIYYEGFGIGANVDIGWNILHDELGGRCIQVYGHLDTDRLSGLSIHDNVVYNCPYDGILVGNSDATYKAWISDAVVYNNVVYNVLNAGIRVDNPGTDARVFHNTVYNNGSSFRIQNAKSVEARNNIFVQTGGKAYVSVEITGSVVMSHNGYSGGSLSSIPSQESNRIVASDPMFTDAANANFSLQSASPFRNAGTQISPALPEVSVPADSTPDLGALGWVQHVTPPASPAVPGKPARPTVTLQ